MCTRRFDAVRASLTNQVTAAYIRRTGVKSSLLAQSLPLCFASRSFCNSLGTAPPLRSRCDGDHKNALFAYWPEQAGPAAISLDEGAFKQGERKMPRKAATALAAVQPANALLARVGKVAITVSSSTFRRRNGVASWPSGPARNRPRSQNHNQ